MLWIQANTPSLYLFQSYGYLNWDVGIILGIKYGRIFPYYVYWVNDYG